jgi:hypothetical protein
MTIDFILFLTAAVKDCNSLLQKRMKTVNILGWYSAPIKTAEIAEIRKKLHIVAHVYIVSNAYETSIKNCACTLMYLTLLKMTYFWDITQCSLVETALHRLDDEGSTHL